MHQAVMHSFEQKQKVCPNQHSLLYVTIIVQDLMAENGCLRESLHNMYQELRTMLNHLQNGSATDPVSVFGICSKAFWVVHLEPFLIHFYYCHKVLKLFMLLLVRECFVL